MADLCEAAAVVERLQREAHGLAEALAFARERCEELARIVAAKSAEIERLRASLAAAEALAMVRAKHHGGDQ